MSFPPTILSSPSRRGERFGQLAPQPSKTYPPQHASCEDFVPNSEINIIVRRPSFRYDSTPRNWMPSNPAFGYQLNGGSLTLPYLEPYLIRVMRQAKQVLAESNSPRFTALSRDIDLFNGQEANHFKIHSAYNRLLRERYEGIEELEAEIEADFSRMLREESLEWNLGYSAGFETTGMVSSQLYFLDAPESLQKADPAVAGLWAWHLAEEYEHRCVALDVFRALGGGYPKRVKLFLYQAKHLNGFGKRAADLMRAQDEANGSLLVTQNESEAHRRLEKKQARFALSRITLAMLPWHEPRRHPALEPADDFLSKLDFA
jgi:predicted metal-dependent hydrolase